MSSYDLPEADPARAARAAYGDALQGEHCSGIAGMNGQPLDTAQRIAHLWMVHSYTHEAIQLCDKKSSVVIALAGSVLAGLLSATGQEGQASLLDILRDPWAVVSLTTLLAAIFLAAVAIKPRLWREAAQGSVFWESILTHRRPQGFADYLRSETVDTVADHLAHQVFTLARVCHRKYVWFAWAFYVSLAGGLLTVVAIVQAQMARG